MDQPYYTPTNTSLPKDFDPFTQNVTMFMQNGTGPGTLISVPMAMFNAWRVETLKSCIVYGSQLGASLIMLMTVVITTRQAKRLQPIFWLNMTSLSLAFIRATLLALFYPGPFQNMYAYFAQDYSMVPRSEYHQSVLGSIATLLLLCSVEVSLVLQTNVVCLTMAPKWRFLVVIFSIVLVLLTCISRIVYAVINIESFLNSTYNTHTVMLAKLCLVTETASIWYFCAVFVGRLAWTMYIRKSIGLKQSGALQIICISGGCTLIIPCKFDCILPFPWHFVPLLLTYTCNTEDNANISLSLAIFAILEWFPDQTFPEAGSLALTVVAIFLPLSSVWASMSVSDKTSPTCKSHASSSVPTPKSQIAGTTPCPARLLAWARWIVREV